MQCYLPNSKMYVGIVFVFFLIVNVGAQTVTLSADRTDVSPGKSIYLICNHDNSQIVTWWRNGENVLSAKVNDGDCIFSPAAVPSYLAGCSCANTVHTCTLKYLTKPTEQWQCSISVSGDVKKSNSLTLEDARPPTSRPINSMSKMSSGSAFGCLVSAALVYFFGKYQ